MRDFISKIIVSIILLFLITGAFSSAANTNNKSFESSQFAYEYYTYQEMVDLFEGLQDLYPDFMSYTSLGKTYENRDVWLVKLSDNVEVNEDEPGVLLMGSIHGDERPPFESLIYLIEHMTEFYVKENTDDDEDGLMNEDPIDGIDNDDDGQIDEDPSEDRVRDIIDNTEVFIIPMVNPDGVEHNTRKNRDQKPGQTNIGVDLNRNFAYKWYLYDIFPIAYNDARTSDLNSWNYRGEEPFSELETKAIKNFIENEDIKISLSYHSYGEVIMYPWTHTSQRVPHEKIFLSVAQGISSIDGYYIYNGLTTILPWPGGTIGTSENWFYSEHGILSFTMELCKSKAPTNPAVVIDCCIKHVGVNLYVCEQAPTVKQVSKVVDKPIIFQTFFTFYRN